jgi:hypothetical protein
LYESGIQSATEMKRLVSECRDLVSNREKSPAAAIAAATVKSSAASESMLQPDTKVRSIRSAIAQSGRQPTAAYTADACTQVAAKSAASDDLWILGSIVEFEPAAGQYIVEDEDDQVDDAGQSRRY